MSLMVAQWECLRRKKMKFLAVEFDTFKDEKYGDLNNDHVGIDVDSFASVKVSNVSAIELELNSGEKLQSWIDHKASSKILEVRLGRILGGKKPVDPLLSHHIDLSRMWKNEDVLLGLSSSSGNSSQKCNIYSWSFVSRTMPHWMHSEPMNPETFTEKGEEDMKVHKTRSDCAMKILAALIFGGGCGALGAVVVLFVFAIFGNRRPVTPEDLAVQPKKLEHKKLGSAIHKAIQDVLARAWRSSLALRRHLLLQQHLTDPFLLLPPPVKSTKLLEYSEYPSILG
ncbi:L-type lectin-domain containing receptor kinase S.6-like [Primulina tabacum]|uniref:L-type lectin-domain containing receptor kinase S.6-like n=1 Tax=Primulina tabacum TaxID=48773 RepID=UPI003F592936